MTELNGGFTLSPSVIKEATTYNPFNMHPDQDTAEFTEDVYFLGANTKAVRDQTVVEVSMKVVEHSATNPNVKFRTDLWLNNDICAGRIRPADADERDWKGTKAALRTLTSLEKALGLTPSGNPVNALTAPDLHVDMPISAHIRVYRANNGQHKWDIRVSKAKVGV